MLKPPSFCPGGHAISPGDRFCGTCGAPTSDTRRAAPLAAGAGLAAWINVVVTASLLNGTLNASASSPTTSAERVELTKASAPPATSAAVDAPPSAEPKSAEQRYVSTYDKGYVEQLLYRWSLSEAPRTGQRLLIAPLADGGYALASSQVSVVADDQPKPPAPQLEGLAAGMQRTEDELGERENWIELQPLRLSVSVNLRQEPKKTGLLVTPLPVGTIVVAALGQIGERTSTLGKLSWAYVTAGPNLSGWVWVGQAEKYTACLPYRGADAWAGGEAWRVALMDGAAPASLLGIRVGERSSEVAVLQADPECSLSVERAQRVNGRVEQAFMVALQEGGVADTLVVSALEDDATVVWSAYQQGQAQSFWTLRVPTFPDRPSEERVHGDGPYLKKNSSDYFPLRMRWPGEEKTPQLFTWNGSSLELVKDAQ